MKTIRDLRDHLEREGLSPEQLARKVRLSNMTIRRMLARDPSEPIPAKHELNLRILSFGRLQDPQDLLRDLERSGRAERDFESVRERLDAKLARLPAHLGLGDYVAKLSRVAFSPGSARARAIAIGALLYLINPFDLIPDALGPVGFIDDLGILALAAARVGDVAKRPARKRLDA